MSYLLRLLTLLLLGFVLAACETGLPAQIQADDDDTSGDDDDTVTGDDDDSAPDDDDIAPDDDDIAPDDDDVAPDDDDVAPDDDDIAPDDDDVAPDDDDIAPDDDDIAPDDDDVAPDDDDIAPDDDDTLPDDDDTLPDDDDTVSITCTPDGFEPNDSDAAAAPVSAGSHPGLTVCDTADDDWYSVALVAGDELTVDLFFSDAEGDIELYVEDPAGNSLGSSISWSDDESVGPVIAPSTGDHLVHVELFSDAGSLPGNSYDMVVGVVPYVATCAPDGFEPNDSDAAAVPIADGSHPGLTACPDDGWDWYALPLTVGETLDLQLMFSHAEGDVDVEVFDPAGTSMGGGWSSSDDELVTGMVAASTGDHLIGVELYDDTGAVPGNVYDLVLTVGGAPICPPDGLEPNDTEAAAQLVTGGSHPGLTSCNDDDWYAVDLVEGAELTVDVLFAMAEGDIDIEVFDPDGVSLGSSNSVYDNESVGPVTAGAAGLHTIQVELYLDSGSTPGNTYDMELTVTDPVCAPDAWEPNDTEGAAVAVTDGSYPGLTACDTDEHDWYSIDLDLAAELTVDLTFLDDQGDIDVQVIEPDGGVLGGGYSVSDDETTGPLLVELPGTHLVHVSLFSDAGGLPGNDYDMHISVVMTCLEDDFEANDSDATAAGIPSTSFTTLAICPTDDDWYSFLAGDGDLIEVDLTFSDAEGDVDLYLYDPSGVEMARSWTTNDDESLSATATADGWHGVEVRLWADAGAVPGNRYEMGVFVTPADPDCVTDDFFEDNDSDTAPAPVDPTWYTNLSSCPSDEDYYALDVLAGQTVDTDIFFADDEGDIDLYLYDESGVEVDYSISMSDDESVSGVAGADGTWVVRTRLFSDAGSYTGNSYEMVLSTY